MKGNNGAPAIPQSRAGIPVIPNEFQTTSNGNCFLLHDSGVGDENRILIFATDQEIDLLKQSDHWFSVSPSIFCQKYTIDATCHGRVVPCIFPLLPNKTQKTYGHISREIETHLNGLCSILRG